MSSDDIRHIENYVHDKTKYGLHATRDVKDLRFKVPCSILIAGKSKCGETHWLLDFLSQWQRITTDSSGLYTKHVYWFYGTPSDKQMSEMKSIFDTYRQELHDYNEDTELRFIHGDFNNPDVKNLLQNLHENSIVVLDDLMDEMTKEPLICKLLTREGHHKKLTVFLLWQDIYPNHQYANTISKNCDYKILFDNKSIRMSVKRMLLNMFPTQKRHGVLFDKICRYFNDAQPGDYPYLCMNLLPNEDPDLTLLFNLMIRDKDDMQNGIPDKPTEILT